MGVLYTIITPTAIVLFFGREFSDAIVPAVVLVWAAVINGLNAILEDALRGLERPTLPAIAEVIALTVTVPLLLVLLPRFQVIGAAVISLMSYGMTLVLLLSLVFRAMKLNPVQILVPRRSDLTLVRLIAQRTLSTISAQQATRPSSLT